MLDEQIARLAAADSLLVCLDFDGTLAELNPDPYAVRLHPVARGALERLAGAARTKVVILSGRHLAGLRRVFPLGAPIELVGSHGAEPGPELSVADERYLDEVEAALREIAVPPAYVEVKPYQRVLHVAPVGDAAARRQLLDRALALPVPAGRPVTPGHNVVEFSALDISKGSWLAAQKDKYAAVLFAGDDVTDDSALAVLDPGNPAEVGIKVGVDVADVDAMAAFLDSLASARC